MKRLFSRGPRRKESKSSKAAGAPKKGGFGFKSSSSVSSAGSTPTIQEDSVVTTTTPVTVNVTIGRSSKVKQLRDQAVAQLEDLLAEKLEGTVDWTRSFVLRVCCCSCCCFYRVDFRL